MSQEFHGNVGQVGAGNINNTGGNTHLELNIHGNNYGPISLGNAGGGSGGGGHDERPISLWLRPELDRALVYWRAQWWSSFRGYWLNIPCLLMLALLFGVAGSLFAGILPIRDPQHMWWVLAPTVLVMLGLSFWLTHIRRIEGRVMAESRAAIDAIRTELRKRRWG